MSVANTNVSSANFSVINSIEVEWSAVNIKHNNSLRTVPMIMNSSIVPKNYTQIHIQTAAYANKLLSDSFTWDTDVFYINYIYKNLLENWERDMNLYTCSMLQLIVTATDIPNSLILFTLMLEIIRGASTK
jgi:hypothetical protein